MTRWRPIRWALASVLLFCVSGTCCLFQDSIFDELEDIADDAEPISTFDGEWMGVEFAYTIEIADRIGTVTQSNTPAYAVGDPILAIIDVDGGRFDGRHVFTDGCLYDVIGSLTGTNTITLSGGGFTWRLERFKVNIPPVADDQTVPVPFDTPTDITLTGSDADNSPGALTFALSSLPSAGKLTGAAPNVTYTPNPGFVGNDSFTFTANDGQDDSAPGTVLISIVPSE